MVLYEVNLDVAPEAAAEFQGWLGNHVAAMLRLPGFLGASVYARRPEDEDGVSERALFTVHYRLADEQALADYFREHAAAMRREGRERFPGAFRATRRVLYDAPGEWPLPA